jgi:hypothetical protein
MEKRKADAWNAGLIETLLEKPDRWWNGMMDLGPSKAEMKARRKCQPSKNWWTGSNHGREGKGHSKKPQPDKPARQKVFSRNRMPI